MFMAIASELLFIISITLINSSIETLSQAGGYYLIPSFLFLIVTVMYWIEAYAIGEEKLKVRLNNRGGYP